MATPSEKLAESLEELRVLQEGGHIAIQAFELSRTHRERLVLHGFLQEIMKGWYIPVRPDETAGESTTWYASYWKFCAAYLDHRYEDWSLSPEQSIALHAENWTVPKQMLVRADGGRNQLTQLPFGTSLLEVRAALPEKPDKTSKDGLRMFALPAALITASPTCFVSHSADMRAALATLRDSSEVLAKLLEGGRSVVAGRLAGAFRNIGRSTVADEIMQTMKAAGYAVRETDPFAAPSPILFNKLEPSPYVNRLRLMWLEMREPILARFPQAPGLHAIKDAQTYLQQVEDLYVSDAYHSLSIEGYRVTPDLIERVRTGAWNPDRNSGDRAQVDALAARGYWQAFQKAKSSVEKVLAGANVGTVVATDHREWYREMFTPSVVAGLLKPGDLAGYRSSDVFIRRSMHVPPHPELVRDAMPVLFELLAEEPEPAVRVVLGHFLFVYIHPYSDGNGRIGRLLMNTMMAAGGYPWLVIPVEEREAYMAALEAASVERNIEPFVEFLGKLMKG
ncbi:MAG: Fic family protein [Gammaproteobacteria bacterium]|nr:Fic family protein [Gammaproteobacteria bacterium]